MKRFSILLVAVALAVPLAAQQKSAAPGGKGEPKHDQKQLADGVTAADLQKTVATINSETITLGRLDDLYNNMTPQLRDQYEKNGGKSAFLDNYVRKRLLLQEAFKKGFDRRHDVQVAMQAAAEGALFDKYVRDVVSTTVVPDSAVRQFYDENANTFARPEQVKVRHIIVTFNDAGPHAKTKEQAEAEIKTISNALKIKLSKVTGDKTAATIHAFDEAARVYSEDGTANQGGDLGWFGRGVMDPTFEKVAFSTPPGTISEPFQSSFGFHVLLVEAKRPAGNAPFDEVKERIREQLLSQHGAEIMQLIGKTTMQLRMSGKVTVFPENIK